MSQKQAMCALGIIAATLWAWRDMRNSLVSAAAPSTVYVAVDGRPGNNGDVKSPLDLPTVLKPRRIAPGTTILMRSGTYNGPLRSDLTGTESAPITLRSAPGENAVITAYQGRGDGGVLNVYGAWTVYRDFEVLDSSRDRLYGSKFRLMGLNILAPHTRFINLVVHDAGHGFGFWKEAVDSELYGNIIFNNGTANTAEDMRHGHAIYTQNNDGEKSIRDNVMFNQYGWGIHAYPSPGGVTGYRIEGNISFDNGLLSHPNQNYPNLMVSGHRPFKTDKVYVRNNFTYYPQGQSATGKFMDANLCLGCSDPETNGRAEVTGNYLVNGSPVVLANGWEQLTITDNTIFGNSNLIALNTPKGRSYTIDHNTYFAGGGGSFSLNGHTMRPAEWQSQSFDVSSIFQNDRPATNAVFVRSNQYESGRANIVVYNWTHAASVRADVSTVLRPGARYRLWSVQNLSKPVAEGTWTGGPLTLPMGSVETVSPLGDAKHSGRDLTAPIEFGVFLLRMADAQCPKEMAVALPSPTVRTAVTNERVTAQAAGQSPDPLAKLRPFEGDYRSTDGKARAVITADTSGLSLRILNEKDTPEYRLTQENGTRFKIDGMPAGFYVDFKVEGNQVRGITLERGQLRKVYLARQ